MIAVTSAAAIPAGKPAANPQPPKTRLPRVALAEARAALRDYLHLTRGLPFSDAEHLSRHSPAFLRRLLSHAADKSLSRFLRYHPINEFEPFLESLGLPPSQIPSLLPRRLFFLTDNPSLLDNYLVLCNYGVPRRNLGRIYKEAREVFQFPNGQLSSKLASLESLGLEIPTVIKLVSSSPSTLVDGVSRELLLVLERLSASGLSQDWFRRCILDEKSHDWKSVLEFLLFLDELGVRESSLRRLMEENPGFLFGDSGKKKLSLLIALFFKMGMKIDDVFRLILICPRILDGLDRERVAEIVSSSPLTKSGLETVDIRAMIETMTPPKVPGGGHLHEKTTFLLRLGFVENSDEMVAAMRKFRGRGDQLQERFDCLVAAGLDCHAVAGIVKEAPPLLNQRTAVLRQKIDYLVNDLGYPVNALLGFPTYLCYSQRRIRLRFSMYGWLRERGLGKEMVPLSTILAGSNERFMNYFVNRHPDGPEEWERMNQREEMIGAPERVSRRR